MSVFFKKAEQMVELVEDYRPAGEERLVCVVVVKVLHVIESHRHGADEDQVDGAPGDGRA